jgi:hypothetical protein
MLQQSQFNKGKLMKKQMISLTLLALAFTAVSASDKVTLNEAERMVDSGQAILVKLPKNVNIAQVTAADVNQTNVAETNTTSLIKSVPEAVKVAETVKQIEVAQKAEAKKEIEGVSIAMPTTLSSLLNKLSQATGEAYFCDDELNIPAARIKIKSIDHLNKYLKQVTTFAIEIVRDSNDPAIPKVLKVVRTDKGEKK